MRAAAWLMASLTLGCNGLLSGSGSVIADLRCEAVDIKALTAWIARTLGPEYRIVQTADEEFPFLVTLSVRRAGGAGGAGKRPRSAR